MQIRYILCTALAIGMTATAQEQVKFEDYFLPKTMRLDYYHAGDAKSEHFFLDEVIEEPYWAGNKHYLVDDRNVGNHRFEVKDKATGKVIKMVPVYIDVPGKTFRVGKAITADPEAPIKEQEARIERYLAAGIRGQQNP